MSNNRVSPLEMGKDEFRAVGHELIDSISAFIDSIRERPVTTGETPKQLANLLGQTKLPENGNTATELLTKASDLLFNHSLLNGHPKFFGYITSSAAPIGALADLLAAAVNANVGAQILSPVATEMEKQTIQWLAELIGIPSTCGGILVSGGNMANFTAFVAGTMMKAPGDIKSTGLKGIDQKMTIYCSKATHSWVEKAMVLFGHGTNSLRWIETDAENK